MTYEEQKEKDKPVVDAWHEALRKEIAVKQRGVRVAMKDRINKILLAIFVVLLVIMALLKLATAAAQFWVWL